MNPQPPSGKTAVLYDGHCKFCTASARKLLRLARPGAIELVDFQEPGVLARFPGLTYDDCMRQMYVVTPTGRAYGGFEAAVRAVATRPVLGGVAFLYYVPGLRQLCDAVYRWIAANRYRLLGKTVAEGGCDGGTCALHLPPAKPQAARRKTPGPS
jgi:predicted DCC family thiol-disulfide oxidoreductase YuxK